MVSVKLLKHSSFTRIITFLVYSLRLFLFTFSSARIIIEELWPACQAIKTEAKMKQKEEMNVSVRESSKLRKQ